MPDLRRGAERRLLCRQGVDGRAKYDFEQRFLNLIDLDHYSVGPYVLEHDRQLGSRSPMAPEEFVRGATIHEHTTVFTLGRFGLVFLGCARQGEPRRVDFRGGDALWNVLRAATRVEPSDRTPQVSQLLAEWDAATAP